MNVKNILILFMNHLFYISIILFLIGLGNVTNSHIFVWVILALIPYYFYFLHACIERTFFRIALHCLPIFLILLLKLPLFVKIMSLIMIALYMTFSFINQLTTLISPKAFIPLLGVFLMVEVIHTKNNWEAYYIGAAVLYLILYIIYMFLDRCESYICLNKNSASNIPEKEIIQSGLKRTFLFAGLSSILFIPVIAFDWFSGITAKLTNLFLLLLKKFIFWLQTLNVTETKKEPSEPSANMALDFSGFENNDKLHAFWQIFDKIIPPIITILLLVGLFFLIRVIYKIVKENFHWFRRQRKVELLSNKDVCETCEIDALQKKEPSKVFWGSPRSRIRKLYRKRILEAKEEVIGNRSTNELEYMTAKECCDKLSEDALRIIYEKAKYSDEEITSADVRLQQRKRRNS